MRKILVGAALVSASFLLLGCSSTPAESDPSATTDSAAPQAAAGDTGSLSIAHIASCDDVESLMAPYIEGLVQAEGNIVDEWGASCTWTMADDETDWANAREVSLSVTPVEPGTPTPDLALLTEIEGTELLEDPWLNAHDGIAYATQIGTDTIGAVITSVWTPSYEVTVGGGSWENQPSLDASAALVVAQGVFK